jgi:hypothetical protein
MICRLRRLENGHGIHRVVSGDGWKWASFGPKCPVGNQNRVTVVGSWVDFAENQGGFAATDFWRSAEFDEK